MNCPKENSILILTRVFYSPRTAAPDVNYCPDLQEQQRQDLQQQQWELRQRENRRRIQSGSALHGDTWSLTALNDEHAAAPVWIYVGPRLRHVVWIYTDGSATSRSTFDGGALSRNHRRRRKFHEQKKPPVHRRLRKEVVGSGAAPPPTFWFQEWIA